MMNGHLLKMMKKTSFDNTDVEKGDSIDLPVMSEGQNEDDDSFTLTNMTIKEQSGKRRKFIQFKESALDEIIFNFFVEFKKEKENQDSSGELLLQKVENLSKDIKIIKDYLRESSIQ